MTTTTAKLERGLIATGGMGGFLNPPTHPEHTQHVEIDLRRRPENRGSMSLSAAADAEYLDGATRASACRLLSDRVAPPIDSPEVVAWVRQVLGYFRGCYVGQESTEGAGDEWNASRLRILPDADPVLNADIHAGVHLIRKYYPAFVPTADDFTNAKWGTLSSSQL